MNRAEEEDGLGENNGSGFCTYRFGSVDEVVQAIGEGRDVFTSRADRRDQPFFSSSSSRSHSLLTMTLIESIAWGKASSIFAKVSRSG